MGQAVWAAAPQGFDEVFDRDGRPKPHYAPIVDLLGGLSAEERRRREELQTLALRTQGITFNVYGSDDGEERIFPFDFVPRIIPASEWRVLEKGLIQRVEALNVFLNDLYSEQRILKDGVIPWDLILGRDEYRRELMGVTPPHGIFTHIVGTDLIRDGDGTYRVLEDNCRCPSGVSYVLENRSLLQRTMPELFGRTPVRPVRDYPERLLETLGFVSPGSMGLGAAVVLTPGRFNSAFFEHSFLAREMGIPLVEGSDLLVEGNTVYVRTTEGRRRVDVIYRRVDDEFLDPLQFRRDSILGVPGLVNAYRAGNVALVNAPGAGVADDKAVYAYMPAVIRYYLGEEPILEQVPTFTGFRDDDFAYMVENLDKLVVKMTGEAGGYGMLMGPMASRKERADYLAKMQAHPEGFIAQPLVELSSHPTHLQEKFVPRRVDLRPFILYGDRPRVMAGGLTRVALTEGSYVVNSSQGGGSKDTWVLEDRSPEEDSFLP